MPTIFVNGMHYIYVYCLYIRESQSVLLYNMSRDVGLKCNNKNEFITFTPGFFFFVLFTYSWKIYDIYNTL